MNDAAMLISMTALDAVAVGVLVYQGDTLVFANKLALDLFRCTASGLQTVSPLSQLTADGDLDGAHSVRLSRPDGSTFAARCQVTAYSSVADCAKAARWVTIIPVSPSEDALSQAVDRYQTMLDSVPSMVYQFRIEADGNSKFDYASAACRELNGIEPELALQSMRFLPAPHPDELDAYNAAIRKSQQTLTTFDWQGRFLRHDDPNDIRWFRMISRPTLTVESATVWTGVQIDITSQRQVEDALRDANQQYDDLVTSLPGVVFRGRYEAPDKIHFDYVSPNAREITGINSEDFIDNPDLWQKWVPEDDRSGLSVSMEATVHEVEQTNQIITTERRVEVNGEGRWLRTRARFRKLTDNLVFITGIQNDVTEQRQAELAFHDSEERYRILVEGSPDSMTFQDLELRYTWVKESIMEAVNKISPIGKTDEELLKPDDAAFLTRIKRGVITTGQIWRGEFNFVLNDGRHWVEACYIPRRDHLGQIVGLAGYVQDITERKQMEQALHDSEERYRLLVEGSPDTMFFQDSDLHYVWHRDPTRSAEPDHLTIKNTDYDLFQPDDAAYIISVKQQVLATGKTWHGEIYTGPESDRRYFDAVYIPRRNQDDHIVGLAGYMREITQRKYSEFALRDSEALIRHVTEYAPFMIYLFDASVNKTLYINQYSADFFGKSIPELLVIGNPVTRDAIHPDDLSAINNYRSEYVNLADQGAVRPFECRIKNGKNEWRWVMTQTRVLTQNDDGVPKLIVSMVLDITERKRAEELEREHRQLLEVLRDTATLMHNTLDLDEVLDQVMETIDQVVPFDAANILMIENESARVARHVGYSVAEIGLIEANFSKLDLWRFSYNLAVNQQLSAFSDYAEYTKSGEALTVTWVRAFISMPLYAGGKIIGVLNLVSRTPDFYTESHIERLQAFANQSAAAIQNARLHQESQALAASNERQRLARELHDSVTQTLFSASMVAQTLPHLWSRGEEHVRHGLDELARLTLGALAEMRTMLVELRPMALETADLPDLIMYLLNAMAGRTSIQSTLTTEGDWRPPADVQIAAYRVVQEALNNVVKHAYATHVTVTIQRKPGEMQIAIVDNGLGFDTDEISADHFGLDIMQERAADVQATLNIRSEFGRGSTIQFIWSASSTR